MPQSPRSSYTVEPRWVRPLVDLSPVTIARLAQEFGCSRVNLFGALAGRPTLGDKKFLDFLEWMGLGANTWVRTPSSLESSVPGLKPGLHVWEIKSDKGVRALDMLRHSQEKLTFDTDLVLAPEGPNHEWVRLRLEHSGIIVLLSVRPQMLPLVRDRLPALRQIKRLWLLRLRYAELVGQLGASRWCAPHQVPSPMVLDPTSLELIDKSEQLLQSYQYHPEMLTTWAAWLRRDLQIDTATLPLPDNSTQHTEPENRSKSERHTPLIRQDEFDEEPYPVPCREAWRVFTHQLDIGEGTHADTCDIPLFKLGDAHEFPCGMVRMHRSVLGDELLDLGKARRLRLYRFGAGDLYLVGLFETQRCGAAPLADHQTPYPQPVQGDFECLLLEGNQWRIERHNDVTNPSQVQGIVLGRWQHNFNAVSQLKAVAPLR